MGTRNGARSRRLLSLGLATFLGITIHFAINGGSARAQQPVIISSETNPEVQVNLSALPGAGKTAQQQPIAPRRIVDGETIIILVPPSLQKKDPPKKIATPRIKPSLSIPKIKMAALAPAENAAQKPAAATKTIPTPPINPAKFPTDAPDMTEETLADIPNDKLETMVQPAAGDDGTTLPTTAEAAATKEDLAKQAAEKVTPREAETQIATIAPAPEEPARASKAEPSIGKLTRILFDAGTEDLPATADPLILAVAEQLKTDREFVQLVAHATGESTSAARRLSLGRALAVRSKLMALGVDNSKIEVRALGFANDDTPLERVDLVLIAR